MAPCSGELITEEIAGVAEVLIISGAVDYRDPLHGFDETSLNLAVIAGLDHQVTVSNAVEKALAEPDPGHAGAVSGCGRAW